MERILKYSLIYEPRCNNCGTDSQSAVFTIMRSLRLLRYFWCARWSHRHIACNYKAEHNMETYWERWNSSFCCDAKWRIISIIFPIQILLIFLRFELAPNFIFEFYIPMLQTQTWQFYLFFPALSISSKFQVLNLRMGRSRDPLLQKAY